MKRQEGRPSASCSGAPPAAAMTLLSAREKELLSLVYFADRSLKDAAEKLGLSAAYAAVVKRRALQKMKKQLA